MTVLKHANFVELQAGWIFALRGTITRMLRAGGIERHHSAFHRIFACQFATAAWRIDSVGLAVYDLIRKLLPQETVFLAGDDTLLSCRGLKMLPRSIRHGFRS